MQCFLLFLSNLNCQEQSVTMQLTEKKYGFLSKELFWFNFVEFTVWYFNRYERFANSIQFFSFPTFGTTTTSNCFYQGFPGSLQFFLEDCRASHCGSKHRSGPYICLNHTLVHKLLNKKELCLNM